VPLWYRPELQPGFKFSGPGLLAEDHATLLVPPGFAGEVLPQGHLRLRR
jgi:N-methylhydantoinase A/oxoprolinase/acetone carboxylase beta subunit